MDQSFRDALVAAAIGDMDRALGDPDTYLPEHVQDMLCSVILNPDGSVEADLALTDLPRLATGGAAESVIVDGREIALDPTRGPSTLLLTVTNHISGTISFYDLGAGATVLQQLTLAQQQVLDRYVADVLFTLTGIANGELLHEDVVGSREFVSGRRLVGALEGAVENAVLVAAELRERVERTAAKDGGLFAVREAHSLSKALADVETLMGRVVPLADAWFRGP